MALYMEDSNHLMPQLPHSEHPSRTNSQKKTASVRQVLRIRWPRVVPPLRFQQVGFSLVNLRMLERLRIEVVFSGAKGAFSRSVDV